jgi:N-acetylneuraminic acid mutarotase
MSRTFSIITFLSTCSALVGCESTPADPTGSDPVEAPSLAVTASNTWAVKRPVTPWRAAMAAATINGSVYVVGGWHDFLSPMARVDAYNVATNTWSRVPSMPRSRYYPNGASMINGKLYVSGGFNANHVGTRTFFVYDPGTGTWTQKADVPQASCRGAQVVIGGMLYVYTGCYAKDRPGGVLFRYDPATNTWLRRAAPPTDHRGGAGAMINGKLYLVGGLTPDCGGSCETVSNTLHAYDPTSNSWTTKRTMPGHLGGFSAVALNGRLYLVGGTDDFSPISTQVYDPGTDTWTQKAKLPVRSWIGAAAAAGGKIVYVAGEDDMAHDASKVYVYTP